jgi:hypothetical protein
MENYRACINALGNLEVNAFEEKRVACQVMNSASEKKLEVAETYARLCDDIVNLYRVEYTEADGAARKEAAKARFEISIKAARSNLRESNEALDAIIRAQKERITEVDKASDRMRAELESLAHAASSSIQRRSNVPS